MLCLDFRSRFMYLYKKSLFCHCISMEAEKVFFVSLLIYLSRFSVLFSLSNLFFVFFFVRALLLLIRFVNWVLFSNFFFSTDIEWNHIDKQREKIDREKISSFSRDPRKAKQVNKERKYHLHIRLHLRWNHRDNINKSQPFV